ncbi:hypothetical protein FHX42_005234 [Saccharopolyspora lacisalsi]|uniref:Uncharacterized protein n=1 Tax=Halosaccharopolyspora lacisalsi TaxID=1000566 RepID=A0A839E803_9PSEU|nr:hypothetical protein [Halosaccharopolyspora lacisalsi]MBA8827827.1 hypothetical protein [Halosaccharopolyspora lacisalsi]
MSWLQPAPHEERAHTAKRNPSDAEFARTTVFVERDLDSEKMITTTVGGSDWVYAYPSYELLERCRGFSEELDHIMLTGRQLKQRLLATTGIVWRPNEIDEDVLVYPQATPVQRVVVE